jgi:hypothetical protein
MSVKIPQEKLRLILKLSGKNRQEQKQYENHNTPKADA